MQFDRNTIVILVLAAIAIIAWEYFLVMPAARREQARRNDVAEASQQGAAPLAPVVRLQSRAEAKAASLPVPIDTPTLQGSIALKGARIDDLFLCGRDPHPAKDTPCYRETVNPHSPAVELLRPFGSPFAYFAEFGWAGQNVTGLPGSNTVWTLASGDVLSPGHPVVLAYDNGQGLTFHRQIAVDDRFLFTVTDTVANHTAAPITLAPYGSVQRQGIPATLGLSNIVHEGAIGGLGVDHQELRLLTYKDWRKKGVQSFESKGGWVGITDKYWMATLLPSNTESITAKFKLTHAAGSNLDIYESNYLGEARAIPPGMQISETTRLFAGAKTVPLLERYSKDLGFPCGLGGRVSQSGLCLVDAVDWGNLWFLTKPIFYLVDYFYRLVGNFGLAILMLTVVIRAIMFPLANKSYEMAVKMKKLQPQIQEMQKKLKEDPAAQQKEMMALYQREKVNPVTGCIPIFLQIPVFYSLTKLFTVTIEMRHAPFFGWIKDLSAGDPTTIWNLFGLIPWDPFSMGFIHVLVGLPVVGFFLGAILHLGVWPIAYGLSIWLSQSMAPQTGMDPTQQKIIQFMPLLFTLFLTQYAVGLLIYWTWSGCITIIQQYLLMRRFKVDNPVDDFLGRFSRPKATG